MIRLHDLETGTPQLVADLERGVLTLTMNRPEARNALTGEMLEALATQLARAEVAADVRCIILTGAGKGFCAGGDVKAMAAEDNGTHPGDAVDDYIHCQRLIQRATAGKLFEMTKPTLAVVNGAAAGAGLALALGCDLRIMAADAILMTAFARVGVSGDFGGTYFMTKLVGAARARELYLLSDRVSADRAYALGLTNWVTSPENLLVEATSIAQRLATGPTIAYRYMKENLNRAMQGNVFDCLDLEATHHVHCMATDDHCNAAIAFTEKREPIFQGR